MKWVTYQLSYALITWIGTLQFQEQDLAILINNITQNTFGRQKALLALLQAMPKFYLTVTNTITRFYVNCR